MFVLYVLNLLFFHFSMKWVVYEDFLFEFQF
ncbi:hypothetical protein T4A_7630 [Trichinella pseudospiralis]|uniref:Uncharacterized protein n=1 Tax=Trichinella pseudospiralis TaxID=6337 RepID=A0A0V1DKM0_TRIPS|nr:hypothetical protein T4A_7650 [Trichinella pseudospiralis]KRY61878.1 hypothetical protein T4A_7630 [Trichinella pseudospiralis]